MFGKIKSLFSRKDGITFPPVIEPPGFKTTIHHLVELERRGNAYYQKHSMVKANIAKGEPVELYGLFLAEIARTIATQYVATNGLRESEVEQIEAQLVDLFNKEMVARTTKATGIIHALPSTFNKKN